ncbi:MAG: hypothetical protein PHV34_02555 [Verrucomicrobiae bacterium]|nr:hypothetical protein [Verrucomicrobiae bacterium]
MTLLDWLIVIIPTIGIGWVAYVTQGYVRSVADFMAASRVAGRYLICNARGEMGMSVVGFAAGFEMLNKAGFTMSWWGKMSIPIGLFISLLGFVIYRYRETRAMTVQQFFEIRYSKSFRVFAGLLAFVSGVANYGIFPAVAARFFVYFCQLPQEVHLGSLAIPTFALVMAFYLAVSLYMTLSGGQLTIMVTDCLEGIISMALYFVLIIALLLMFHWSQIYEAMAAQPAGKSFLDPFDTGAIRDFNIWYVLIGMFGSVYGVMGWQGGHAFNSCAASAHEAKMGSILGGWRGSGRVLVGTLLGVCAYTYLNHPDFAAGAQVVNETLKNIAEPQIRNQMTSPVALGYLLPAGVKGVVCALVFFGLIACDGSYLHSWGSILIQDVILPFRKTPFEPRQHLRYLRWAITGVAIFGFLFSLLYRQTEYILMFFALTGAIFLGGSGSVLIGGLYWKKGTTPAAWAAMITGSFLAVGGIVINQFPFATVPMKIKAPEATEVTIQGQPARQNGDVWEYDFQIMRMGEWQDAQVAITTPKGITTNTVYYVFGVKAPDKEPAGARQAQNDRGGISPGNLTLIVAPQGILARWMVAIRDINGQVKYFIAMLSSVLLYIVISLLTCKEDFNMDRMLHRGVYAMEPKDKETGKPPKKFRLESFIGIDENFSRGDKVISWSVFLWSFGRFSLFLVITFWNLIERWPVSRWATYFRCELILIPVFVAAVTTVWFVWGGIRDLIRLFRSLKTVKRNKLDDGMVVGHHNADE